MWHNQAKMAQSEINNLVDTFFQERPNGTGDQGLLGKDKGGMTMPGLADLAAGSDGPLQARIAAAHEAWQVSMARRIDELRGQLAARNRDHLAALVEASLESASLRLMYWGRAIEISWPELELRWIDDGQVLSTFDTAMILYYLDAADGTSLADRWISFRELPNGAFYHQAFQGYSGDLLANRFGENLHDLERAASTLGGVRLPDLAPTAYSFQPLPRLRLAAAMWPGDDDFHTRASILFDAACSHAMTTDGLALLGSGLARRLIQAASA